MPRPASWGGYAVTPERVEFWQGRRGRLHDRLAYTRADDGTWRVWGLGHAMVAAARVHGRT